MADPTDHIGLAHSVARRMWLSRPWRYMEFSDVLQEALLGLCRAAKNYDPSKGVAFSTYATRAMERTIKRAYYANKRIAHFGGPKTVMRSWMLRDVDSSRPVDMALAQAAAGFLKPLTASEVERYYGYAVGSDSSLDILVSLNDDAEDETPLVETMADESSTLPIEHSVSGKLLARIVQKLCSGQRKRERALTILRDRILADELKHLEDIAAEWGCTRQRVHQIEVAIVNKLREILVTLGVHE